MRRAQRLIELGRKLSTATVMFHWAIADRLGLNVTDWKCADLVTQAGSLTAGQLAGLSTGAITGVIDRLEAAGFVERRHDPNDRRKVLVYPLHGRDDEVYRIFSPLLEANQALLAQYDQHELQLITEYIRRTVVNMNAATEALRGR